MSPKPVEWIQEKFKKHERAVRFSLGALCLATYFDLIIYQNGGLIDSTTKIDFRARSAKVTLYIFTSGCKIHPISGTPFKETTNISLSISDGLVIDHDRDLIPPCYKNPPHFPGQQDYPEPLVIRY